MPNRSSLWRTVLKAITSFRKSEYTVTITLAILIGLLGGFGAIGFRALIRAFQSISYGSGEGLVVDKDNPKRVVGMLKRTDVIVAYNNAVLRRGLERR